MVAPIADFDMWRTRNLALGGAVALLVVIGMVVMTIPMLRSLPRNEELCGEHPSYAWDAEVGACVDREDLERWGSAEGSSRHAAYIAVQSIGAGRGLFVFSVDAVPCIGCYDVVLERRLGKQSFEQMDVALRDWQVVPKYAPPQSDRERCAATAGATWCEERGRCMSILEPGCPTHSRAITYAGDLLDVVPEVWADELLWLLIAKQSLVFISPDPSEVLRTLRRETGINFGADRDAEFPWTTEIKGAVQRVIVHGIQMRAEHVPRETTRTIFAVFRREGFTVDRYSFGRVIPEQCSGCAYPLGLRDTAFPSWILQSGSTICAVEGDSRSASKTENISMTCG